MGLRLSEGIDLGRFETRTGQTLAQSVDGGVLDRCISELYLTLTPERLIATREGRIRLDSLLSAALLGTHPTSAVLSDGGYFAKRVTLSLALRSSGDAGRGFGRVGAAAALVA